MYQGENLHFERPEYIRGVECGYAALQAARPDEMLMFRQEGTIT